MTIDDNDDDDNNSIYFSFHNITDVTCICSSQSFLLKKFYSQIFSFDLVQ